MRNSFVRLGPIVLGILAISCSILTRATLNSAERGVENRAGGTATPLRHREGTNLTDQLGTIRHSADRIHFRLAEGAVDFRLLENLALERVLRTVEESKTDRLWSVSGTVMEFQGENYLLLSRAVLTSKQPSGRESPPTPGQSR